MNPVVVAYEKKKSIHSPIDWGEYVNSDWLEWLMKIFRLYVHHLATGIFHELAIIQKKNPSKTTY